MEKKINSLAKRYSIPDSSGLGFELEVSKQVISGKLLPSSEIYFPFENVRLLFTISGKGLQIALMFTRDAYESNLNHEDILGFCQSQSRR